MHKSDRFIMDMESNTLKDDIFSIAVLDRLTGEVYRFGMKEQITTEKPFVRKQQIKVVNGISELASIKQDILIENTKDSYTLSKVAQYISAIDNVNKPKEPVYTKESQEFALKTQADNFKYRMNKMDLEFKEEFDKFKRDSTTINKGNVKYYEARIQRLQDELRSARGAISSSSQAAIDNHMSEASMFMPNECPHKALDRLVKHYKDEVTAAVAKATDPKTSEAVADIMMEGRRQVRVELYNAIEQVAKSNDLAYARGDTFKDTVGGLVAQALSKGESNNHISHVVRQFYTVQGHPNLIRSPLKTALNILASDIKNKAYKLGHADGIKTGQEVIKRKIAGLLDPSNACFINPNSDDF